MNSFNKLYNLILESIITQNRAGRKTLLQKKIKNHYAISQWLRFLDNFDNKTADFLCKYIADGTIKDGLDKRVDTVVQIIKINKRVDTQNYKGTLDQFIEQNKEVIDKHNQKISAKSEQYLDSIPQFKNKQTFDKGVVVYQVQDSKAGQLAVRKIVDAFWGHDANPWCLIAREAYCEDEEYQLDQAWKMWQKYSAYPKQIAFQRGKLLAFRAEDDVHGMRVCDYWWDRQDQDTKNLILLDGSQMEIPEPEFDQEGRKQFFARTKRLDYNYETKRWDSRGMVDIDNYDLVNGEIPVPLGVVNGWFDLDYCNQLKNLDNGPTKITAAFTYAKVPKKVIVNSQTWKNYQEQAGERLIYMNVNRGNGNIEFNKETGLYDAVQGVRIYDHTIINGKLPIKFGKVGGCFLIEDDNKITTLQGCPQEVGQSFICQNVKKITSLVGCPKKVGNSLRIRRMPNLQSLQGAPEEVGGQIVIERCPNISQEEIEAYKKRVKKS